MSDLATLVSRFRREILSFGFPVSIVVADATSSVTVTHSPSTTATGRMADISGTLSRIMAGAHPGAVIVATVTATGETATLAAPGGAFDARSLTPSPPIGKAELSTAGDLRAIVPGALLPQPTRALLVHTAGTLALRTVGTPGTIQPAFSVAAGVQLPIAVLEVGAASTAGVIGLF